MVRGHLLHVETRALGPFLTWNITAVERYVDAFDRHGIDDGNFCAAAWVCTVLKPWITAT